MPHFQAVPLSRHVAEQARARAARGDPAVLRRIATESPGYPCRRCLTDASVGEEMLLFAHSPFTTPGPYAETGPVFVHARACADPALAADMVPEVTRVRDQVIVRAYDQAGAIHDAALVKSPDVGAALRTFFEDASVAFAHVRSVTYGCFTYRVERA